MSLRNSFALLSVLALACATAAPALEPASGVEATTRPTAPASADVSPSTVAIETAPESQPQPKSPGVALCDVVCDVAFVQPAADGDGAEDVARATQNANQVLEGIKSELLGCFENRVWAKPQAAPFMTMGIVVGPDGKVKKVVTTESKLVSARALECLDRTVRRVSFEPPRGHGTMRIEVPFMLRKADEAE